ncbi:MAG: ABC transporter permease [Nocardioides sp.]|nr:ABC transporter permease [Nocardioides sp.]
MSAMTFDLTSTPAVPFWRLVLVETRKTVDTVASFWLVMSMFIITVLLDGFVMLAAILQSSPVNYFDFTQLSLVATSVLLPILGVLLVTGEWGQRTAMVTFSLEPRRLRVVLAKLVVGLVLTVATVLIALVVALACTLVCELFNGDQTTWGATTTGFEGTDASGPALLVGYLLTQAIAMTSGFALAALLLNTPAAIVVYLVYSFALPGVLFAVSAIWTDFADVSPYLNFVEAQAPLATLSLGSAEEWLQLFTSGLLWLGLPLGLGLLRILRAEVK